MRLKTPLLAFALLGLVGCGGWAPDPAPPAVAETGARTPPRAVDSALVARGAALYADHCALCHGVSGEGYAADNAPALANPDFLSVAGDGFLSVSIRYGRPGTPMSAWSRERGGPFDDADIAAVTELLRSWQTEPSIDIGQPRRPRFDGERAERGADVFATHCAACHGDRGQGATALSLLDAYFLSLATDAFLEHAIGTGRRGTPMAAFADSLSADQIGDVIHLLRSWQQPPGSPPALVDVPDYTRHVVINPGGPQADLSPREDRFVPADEIKAVLDEGRRIVLLDARATSDWLASHIPGSIPVPFYDARAVIDVLPRDDTWIIAYCACPHAASGQVVDVLREAGFSRTAILDEGVLVWEERGYPLTSALDATGG